MTAQIISQNPSKTFEKKKKKCSLILTTINHSLMPQLVNHGAAL
jgi:hypothetical protein